ncbi:DMT family transporter [Cognatishimia sp. WU-CL00825]|uniref:DMT family transporter n=1 Tax=Cognatishimia sp. WU-CL00825 TaxID=3127658 RepID=UPI0031057AAD
MRLFVLTVLTMLAFAANSILNRLALVDQGMDAVLFAVIRLGTGAVALALILAVQRRGFELGGARRVWGVAALLLYIFGFSYAYQELDAGIGALILFAVVQITMFGAAVHSKEQMPFLRWMGAGLAFAGLAWLLWPASAIDVSAGQGGISLPHVAMMVLAGLGWGIYSIAGRREANATQATAMNFILAAPLSMLVLGAVSVDASTLSATGVLLATTSGVLTSGLGYALWYSVLPQLGASRGAVAQLTVPVIALLAGLVFLGEDVSLRAAFATVLVLSGVSLSMRRA